MLNQVGKRLLLIVLTGALAAQACAAPATLSKPEPTPLPGATDKPTSAAAKTATSVSANTPTMIPTAIPSVTSTAEKTPTQEPTYDLYAGLVENKEIPFLLLHPSGERAGLIQDNPSSATMGVVWTSSGGETIVIFADESGMPTSAVVGEDIIQYSNYTESTVDVTILHADGSQETSQVELDRDLIAKITALASPMYIAASFSTTHQIRFQQEIILGLLRALVYTLGLAACIGTAVTLPAVPSPYFVVPLLLAEACAGSILTTIIAAGNLANLDVGGLESFSKDLDRFGCMMKYDILGCASLMLDDWEKEIKKADEKVSNLPPLLSDVPTGTVNVEQAHCRYGPGTAYLPLTGLKKGDRVKIEGRNYGSSWLWVLPELLDYHCWSSASVFDIVGDVSAAEIVQPQLPITDDSDMVTGLKSNRNGNMVTFEWNPSKLAANDFRGYLLEIYTCENGVYIFQVLNPQENTITIRDDQDCSQPSGGLIYTAGVRGYSQPVQLPWPK